MTLPRPRKIEAEAKEIALDVLELVGLYRWAIQIAYGPIPEGGEDAGEVRVEGTDSTGELAVGGLQERTRYFARRALRKMRHAAGDISEAKAFLEDLDDPRADLSMFDRAPSVRPDELAGYKAAAARRLRRGQGWGDG